MEDDDGGSCWSVDDVIFYALPASSTISAILVC